MVCSIVHCPSLPIGGLCASITLGVYSLGVPFPPSAVAEYSLERPLPTCRMPENRETSVGLGLPALAPTATMTVPLECVDSDDDPVSSSGTGSRIVAGHISGGGKGIEYCDAFVTSW